MKLRAKDTKDTQLILSATVKAETDVVDTRYEISDMSK